MKNCWIDLVYRPFHTKYNEKISLKLDIKTSYGQKLEKAKILVWSAIILTNSGWLVWVDHARTAAETSKVEKSQNITIFRQKYGRQNNF